MRKERFFRVALTVIIVMTLISGMTASGCKRKVSESVLEDRLKNSMLDYLQHQSNYDSTRISFEVLSVTYSVEPKLYNCEFSVKLRMPGRDTIGIMTGTVSKDFSIVHRTF